MFLSGMRLLAFFIMLSGNSLYTDYAQNDAHEFYEIHCVQLKVNAYCSDEA